TRSRPHLYYLSFFLTQSRRPPDLPSSPTRRSSDLALRARRAQPLVDAGHDLEPVGVVVRDEARRGVEDALVRAMVLGEDDRLGRSEEHTSELQSLTNLVCRLLLEKKKNEHDETARA